MFSQEEDSDLEEACLDEIQSGKSMFVKIKCNRGNSSDFNVCIPINANVARLKEEVSTYLKLKDNETVRLIYNGRMLAPDTASVESFHINLEYYLHAVISQKPITPSRPEITSNNASNRANANSNHSNTQETPTRTGPLRGLDILTQETPNRPSMGINEIEALRAYFSDSIDEYGRTHMTQTPEENDESFRYRVETEWMQAQGTLSEFRINVNLLSTLRATREGQSFLRVVNNELTTSNDLNSMMNMTISRLQSDERAPEVGTYQDFLYGLALGYLLGFLMIFCIWDRNISHRQKLGILCGVMLEMFVNVWMRSTMASSSHDGQHLTQQYHDNNQPITTSQSITTISTQSTPALRGAI